MGAESATMGIFQLGIGPYIDASWTLSLIFLLKIPPEVYSHLQSLRRSGREVSRQHTGTLVQCSASSESVRWHWVFGALVQGCRAEGVPSLPAPRHVMSWRMPYMQCEIFPTGAFTMLSQCSVE